MKLQLNKPFASNSAVEAHDVRQTKRVLNRLGYYMPPKNAGNTHIPDRAVFNALKKFQKERDLRATGEMNPGDATEKALNDAQNEQEEKGGSYIWHTMQDDKVRAGHAALEGQVFSWDSSPEDGHPGEPYNCRCWAENVKDQAKGLKQEVISSINDSEKKWSELDFGLHFILGGGREVTLPEIGYMGEIVDKAREVVFQNVESQVADKMRKMKFGRLIYNTKNHYDFTDVHWILGEGVVATWTEGDVQQDGDILTIEAIVTYQYSDEITDIDNLREFLTGSSKLEDIPYDASKPWWNYKNVGGGLLWTFSDLGGSPYPVSGSWKTKLKGSIAVKE